MPNFRPICIDTSLLMRLVMPPPAVKLKQQWQQWADHEQRDFVAPTLLYYEAVNVIHQYHRLHKISTQKAQESYAFILEIPIQLYGDFALHQEALNLSRRLTLSATYDAHYLALAGRLGAELWTADKRLFNRVNQQFPLIRLWQGE